MYFDWNTGTSTNEDKQYLCYMYDSYVIAWLCYGEEDKFAIIRSVTRHIGPTDIKSFVVVGEAEAIAG